MLAFIRGEDTFDGPGDIWVKLLPNGEPVQLTNDGLRKLGPVFSPDGTTIAYTHIEQWHWDTWTVSSLGGTTGRWLPDASGLTWVGPRQVMFSEITSGLYMKIVTADQNRAGERDVYLPPAEGMAHRSYLSPDGKWVLVVSMADGWLPCRVVPFTGGPQSRIVGPSPSKCTSAAWSPGQKWIYVSADAGNGFHLWRQKFPDGRPEQLTFGATEEEGIAVAPDGKSLVTAIGTRQSSIYLQESGRLRQITSQGFAYSPSISPDGKQIYYIVGDRSSTKFIAGEFRVADLATGHNDSLLPGFLVTRYDISADGQRVVFAAANKERHSSIWLGSLKHSFPPRLLIRTGGRPFFGPSGTIFYLSQEGNQIYVYRGKEDGTDAQKIVPDPVIYLLAVSPDGKEVAAWVPWKKGDSPNAVVIYHTSGGKPTLLCTRCSATGPAYPGAGIVNWSLDQKFFYVRMDFPGMHSRGTFAIPLARGHAIPSLPANGFASADDVKAIPGVREIRENDVFPGRDPSTYVIMQTTTQRNLYRISLPDH
jgi:Tol biopolymer transport system component